MKFVPPASPCSPEDSIRIRIQLRLGSGNRRKMNTEEPNSFERGAHRRTAPVPVRVCFAGAGARAKFVPPTSRRSSEDSIRSRAQLLRARPSPELVRGRWSVPPVRGRSSEDSLRIRTQLRLTFACRRKTNTEERNSVEKGTHRRKAPAPVRVCFAGADARWRCCPPGSRCSTEDRV